MAPVRFIALPTQKVRAVQEGGLDAYGRTPECHLSDGQGNPCRHCLTDIVAGEPMLILAWRPFPEPQPYAELGPIFLHAERCPRYGASRAMPPVLLARERVVLRGYDAGHRIVYGTGRTVATRELEAVAEQLLASPAITYLHVRSSSNGCYQCRVERG